MNKYLGIDWGMKRIGLALADEEIKIASPWKVVENIEEVLRAIEEENIDVAVLGVPYKMHNREAKPQTEFSNFLKDLKAGASVKIETVDERLSSKTADSFIGDKKTKAPRDAASAMVILQQFLDMMSSD